MNVLFWAVFPFICVLLVPVIVGTARFMRWFRAHKEWREDVRTQRTMFEQEEHELMMAAYEVDDEHVQ
jgi:nitrate reductase gamma subunit